MGLDINFYKAKRKDVGYFRKVNFLVKFFEEQGYNLENCKPIEIYKEDITELYNRCKKVLQNPELGPSLLPTCEGFFFGSTDYDDSYINKVEEVSNYCLELLPIFDNLKDDELIEFEINY